MEQPDERLPGSLKISDGTYGTVGDVRQHDCPVAGEGCFAQGMVGTVDAPVVSLQQRAFGYRVPAVEQEFVIEIQTDEAVRNGHYLRSGLERLYPARLVETLVVQIGELRGVY